MSICEVNLLFCIDSGFDFVTADLIRFKQTFQRVELVKDFHDASIQFFVENIDENVNLPKICLLAIDNQVYYPLDETKSVVYRLQNGIYLFIPSPDSNPPNCHLAIALSSTVPESIRETFEDILGSYANIITQKYGNDPLTDKVVEYYRSPHPSLVREGPDPAEVVGNNIVSSAQSLASGMEWVAGHTSELIHKGGSKLKTMNIPKKPTPIDPKVINILRGARIASGCASSIVGAGASALHAGTARLGEAIAPAVTEKGSKIVSQVTGMNSATSKSMIENILTVGSSGVQAFGIIASSLTDSVFTIGKSIAKETVGVVSEVFGSPAAQATDEALQTAGNVASSYQSMRSMRPRAVIRKTAARVIQANRTSSSHDSGQSSSHSPSTSVKEPIIQEP